MEADLAGVKTKAHHGDTEKFRGCTESLCASSDVLCVFVVRFGFESAGTPSPRYKGILRRRRALLITLTLLKVIAALAIMGLSSRPNTGKSTPAARGTPSAL